MTKALSSPDFQKDDVVYGFFGRQGGVSKGVYESLNCRGGSDDDPKDVEVNRKRVADKIGVGVDKLLTLYQVHSDEAVMLQKPWKPTSRPHADAMVTKTKGLALAILTADCAPVLFMGHNADGRSIIGAAHAGWKGALNGILDETVVMMRRSGALKESITACIGPCITQESYEVSQEFYDNFVSYDDKNTGLFIPSKKDGHYMFDLPKYCATRLKAAGVENIILSNIDTYSNENDYFSYRRATHRGEADYGGQMSVIMVK